MRLIFLFLFLNAIALTTQAQKLKINGLVFFKKAVLDESGKLLTGSDSITLISFNTLNRYWKVDYNGTLGYIPDGVFTIHALERMDYIIKKYGDIVGGQIYNKDLRIGMTEDMVKDAFGEPDRINRTVTEYTNSEQWVYNISSKMRLYYFDDDKLTAIQD